MANLDALGQDFAATGGSVAASLDEYVAQRSLNLYKSPACDGLVTQAARGRHLRLLTPPDPSQRLQTSESPPSQATAIQVQLCEDDYSGWLAIAALAHLTPVTHPYQAPILATPTIEQRLPQAIAYAQRAMACPNEYLWGGTIPPNFDCSGLMQAAFASADIRLPRDSYQQEAFTQRIELAALRAGDLLFFGTPTKTTHVALYLGEGRYIHSSGKDQGRNGIGIDSIWHLDHPVSRTYHSQFRCAGRVVASYQPGEGWDRSATPIVSRDIQHDLETL